MAGSITDPLARKLVEWAILRSEDGSSDFWRYSAFINANPSWPNISLLRRRAEAGLWQELTDPQAVIAFFANDPPRSAKGHFALARALLTRGDVGRASAILHEAWRSDAFSSDLEGQAREAFGGLITPADDAARMDWLADRRRPGRRSPRDDRNSPDQGIELSSRAGRIGLARKDRLKPHL